MKTTMSGAATAADITRVLSETEGYMVRIYRDMTDMKIIDDFMSLSLFESCLRTGYIAEMEEQKEVATA